MRSIYKAILILFYKTICLYLNLFYMNKILTFILIVILISWELDFINDFIWEDIESLPPQNWWLIIDFYYLTC